MNEQDHKRRATDPVLDAIHDLKQSFDVRHEENTGHMESLEVKVDKVLAGFPDGDPASHRKFHEALIAKAQAREKFWNDMRAKLIERGIWATVIFFAGLALTGAALAIKNLGDR